MTNSPDAKNVLAALRAATTDDWTEGVNWYVRARTVACDIAAAADITVDAAAGIIAALSPNVSWDRNVRMAWDVAKNGTTKGLGRSVSRAVAIRNGADPLDVLGGPKVRAFYANISDPLFSEAVCVDRHAADVACGAVGTDRSRRRLLDRKGGYDEVAATYRHVAHVLGLLPHQVQAVTWVAWRRRKAVNNVPTTPEED